jgi:hypothetical protein
MQTIERSKSEMKDYSKVQQTLRAMNSKFEKVRAHQQAREEQIKHSRNIYHTHVNEV